MFPAGQVGSRAPGQELPSETLRRRVGTTPPMTLARRVPALQPVLARRYRAEPPDVFLSADDDCALRWRELAIDLVGSLFKADKTAWGYQKTSAATWSPKKQSTEHSLAPRLLRIPEVSAYRILHRNVSKRGVCIKSVRKVIASEYLRGSQARLSNGTDKQIPLAGC